MLKDYVSTSIFLSNCYLCLDTLHIAVSTAFFLKAHSSRDICRLRFDRSRNSILQLRRTVMTEFGAGSTSQQER